MNAPSQAARPPQQPRPTPRVHDPRGSGLRWVPTPSGSMARLRHAPLRLHLLIRRPLVTTLSLATGPGWCPRNSSSIRLSRQAGSCCAGGTRPAAWVWTGRCLNGHELRIVPATTGLIGFVSQRPVTLRFCWLHHGSEWPWENTWRGGHGQPEGAAAPGPLAAGAGHGSLLATGRPAPNLAGRLTVGVRPSRQSCALEFGRRGGALKRNSLGGLGGKGSGLPHRKQAGLGRSIFVVARSGGWAARSGHSTVRGRHGGPINTRSSSGGTVVSRERLRPPQGLGPSRRIGDRPAHSMPPMPVALPAAVSSIVRNRRSGRRLCSWVTPGRRTALVGKENRGARPQKLPELPD